jgi:cob(I)alamin adenosyltransferase
MNMHLIQGNFNAKDALEIITQMIHVKIKFHESKIGPDSNEEDIKIREAKIKRLQKDLHDIRNFIQDCGGKINIQSEIQVSK